MIKPIKSECTDNHQELKEIKDQLAEQHDATKDHCDAKHTIRILIARMHQMAIIMEDQQKHIERLEKTEMENWESHRRAFHSQDVERHEAEIPSTLTLQEEVKAIMQQLDSDYPIEVRKACMARNFARVAHRLLQDVMASPNIVGATFNVAQNAQNVVWEAFRKCEEAEERVLEARCGEMPLEENS